MGAIVSFRDLETWKKGHELVLLVYRYTRDFPTKEMYSLTDQIRRAVVSVTSNVAEGFGRKTKQDKVHFYYMALGSLAETQNQLIIACDLEYLPKAQFEETFQLTESVFRLIYGLIRSANGYTV